MIKCELYFGDKNVGEMVESSLDVKTGFVSLEDTPASLFSASKKWIEFVYEGQKFQLHCQIRNGRVKVKDTKNLSAIQTHMSLDNYLVDSTKNTQKIKI